MKMVKRSIGLIILLSFIVLVIQFGSNLFTNGYENHYVITGDNIQFDVQEVYQKELGDAYYLKISSNNMKFHYTVDNHFNKQKKIIKDIQYIMKDGMMCIFPVFTKKEISVNILCRDSTRLYAYETIKNDARVVSFVDSLKKKGYSLSAWNVVEVATNKATLSTVFNDHILDGDTILVWAYKGLELITKEKNEFLSLYGFDKYENTHGRLVGHYYVVPVYDNNRVFDFHKIHIINLDSMTKKEMELEQGLQQDTYINGVVNDKLYYFDPDHLVQVQIDPKKRSEKVVGTVDDNAQYYDGEFSTVNIYDFVSNKKEFQINYQDNQKLMSYHPSKIYESDTSYYYLTSDGGFYQLNKYDLELPVLLWNNGNMKEIKIMNDSVYFITDDTLYFYQEEYGLHSVIQNQEWNYNSNHIFDVYRKSK
ncbi:MAG: hypothetical protein PUB18_00200 [bacterium]|nr:hypothetical protein [bacterium]